MPTLCHDRAPNFEIQASWIKDDDFEACDLNAHNMPWREGVDHGIKYRCQARYYEHYDVWTRIERIALGVLLSIPLITLCFEKGRALVSDLLFNPVKNIHLIREPATAPLRKVAAIYTSLAANPAQPKQNPASDVRFEEFQKITCGIARGTAMAIAQGAYITPAEKKFPLRTGAQLLEGSRVIANTLLEQAMPPRYEETAISVIAHDCLEAAEDELKKGAKKVAVLMLASPIEPGGAMEEGNQGQEEDLCRRSDIFGFMWDQAHFLAKTSLYNLVDVDGPHQPNPPYSCMNNNRMIHVPCVTVFRAGNNRQYQMLEQPFEVGMLVSPGLDRPEYERANGKAHYTRKEDEQQLLKLIMTQLKVSYDENYDTVILGAFGCGAFYNPPELVAMFYKQVIDTHFKGSLKKIVFAILDDGNKGKHNPEGNLLPFQRCFTGSS